MKANLGILALMCLFMSACATTTPQGVTEIPMLYEQYVVYGDYQNVMSEIDAKVTQCVNPLPRKESAMNQEPGTGIMYFFGDSESAQLVLKLKNMDNERTQVDVYAGDLNKLAWSHLRRSIQYGAEGKAGCPETPQPDVRP